MNKHLIQEIFDEMEIEMKIAILEQELEFQRKQAEHYRKTQKKIINYINYIARQSNYNLDKFILKINDIDPNPHNLLKIEDFIDADID